MTDELTVARCRECGCLDMMACHLVADPDPDVRALGPAQRPVSCHWVAADLCSACDGRPTPAGLVWVHPPKSVTSAYTQGLKDAQKLLAGRTLDELYPQGYVLLDT